MSFCITRRTTDCLNQRSLRTKESFFIRIKNRNKSDFRNIKSFPQKVDSNQHIKHIQTHVSNNFSTFKRINIRMKIFHTDSNLTHIICQIFCHTLRQRCDKNFILLTDLFIHFTDQIINLSFYRSHFNFRIQKSCRTDHLFCTKKLMILLIFSRCRRYKHHLIDLAFKLIKIKRTVILRRRETKPIIYQCLLSRLVSMIHSTNLRDRLM